MSELRAPLQAQLVQWQVAPGDSVKAGDVVVILEAMKMEHEVRALSAGLVRELFFAPGDTVNRGDVLLATQPAPAATAVEWGRAADAVAAVAAVPAAGPPQPHRPDLQRVIRGDTAECTKL
jgi:pyruvate/2-oxoglutarate dehydrogenase complex dihydrolipoamide acyltransferase (E2) component